MPEIGPETVAFAAKLAKDVKTLKRRQRDQARADHSARRAVVGSLPILDQDGNVRVVVGAQADGTVTVQEFGGEPLEQPGAPVVEARAEALVVTFTGFDVADVASYLLRADFSHVGVHVSTEEGFSLEDDEPLARLTNPGGESVTLSLPAETVFYVKLVAHTRSGVSSEPSEEVYGIPEAAGGYTPPALEAPPASPVIDTLAGTPSSLVVATAGVRPEDLIEYHISAVEGFVPVAGDAATLAFPATSSTVATIAAMPDGSPLVAATSYYVAVIARNAAGIAAPSPTVQGELNSKAVEAVIAAKLIAGFVLAGQVTVGNITIHPDSGITILQPGGNVIRFPARDTEFAEITGHLTAQTLAVMGSMTIDGGAVVNSAMVLSAGITPPQTPPTLSAFWPTMKFQDDYGFGDVFYGLSNVLEDDGSGAIDPTWWVTAVAFYGGGVRLIDRNTGAQWGAIETPSWSTINPTGGITQIGNNYYVLGQDPSRKNDWYILRLNHNFVKVSELLYTSSGAFDGRPSIGRNDAGQPIIAFIAAGSKKLSITRRDPVTMQSVSTSVVNLVSANPSGVGSTHNFAGVHEGVTDLGSGNSRIYVATNGLKRVSTYTDAGGVLQPHAANPFNTAGVTPKGVVFDRADPFKGVGRWVSLDNAGNIHKYSGFATTQNYRARSTFVDVNSAGTGQHETAPSAYSATVSIQARAWLRAQVASAPDANSTDPSKPDKADRSRVYVAAAPNEPMLQATLAVQTKTAEFAEIVAGAVAPALSTDFATAGSTAAAIQDPSGRYYFNGQGDASFRNLTVHQPALVLRRVATQSLPASSTNAIAFDRVDFADLWSAFVTGTNIGATSAVTIPRTGLYDITGSLAIAAAGTGTLWHMGLLIDGAAQRILYRGGGSPTSPLVARGTVSVYLQAGQTIGIGSYSTVAGGTYGGTPYATELSARWVGP